MTDNDLLHVRSLKHQGWSGGEIAKNLGVSKTTINRFLAGKTYRPLPDAPGVTK